MASLCSTACSWPSTLRWFPFSVAQGSLMPGVLMLMVQRPWQHEGGNSAATLSWRVRMDVRGWWSLRVKLEGDSPRNVATSSASCPSSKHGMSHPCCNSGCNTLGFTVGGRCWRAAGLVLWLRRCWSNGADMAWMVAMMCFGRHVIPECDFCFTLIYPSVKKKKG